MLGLFVFTLIWPFYEQFCSRFHVKLDYATEWILRFLLDRIEYRESVTIVILKV